MTRNFNKAVLISLMQQLAAYVQSHANGSKAVVISSGFNPTRTPAPIGPLSPPENLRLGRDGMSGELILRMQGVDGVTAGYTVQMAEAAEGPYTEYTTTNKTRVVIAGLTPAKTYSVRACANGAAGPSDWSKPVSAMAV